MSYNSTHLRCDISLPYDVSKLEETKITTTNGGNIYTELEDISFETLYDVLYHGIRFQTYLEKLENIFKEKKILAGKYIKNYYNYEDNCNKGEYVSLLDRNKTNRPSFEAFIEENISLLITPLCNAIETKYVDFQTWTKIKNLNLKHIYSYLPGECMCKDFISLKYVKAIGVPYRKMIENTSLEYACKLLEDIVSLMEKYKIFLPVVDTSRYNQILISPTKKSNESITQQIQKEHVLTKKQTSQKNR